LRSINKQFGSSILKNKIILLSYKEYELLMNESGSPFKIQIWKEVHCHVPCPNFVLNFAWRYHIAKWISRMGFWRLMITF